MEGLITGQLRFLNLSQLRMERRYEIQLRANEFGEILILCCPCALLSSGVELERMIECRECIKISSVCPFPLQDQRKAEQSREHEVLLVSRSQGNCIFLEYGMVKYRVGYHSMWRDEIARPGFRKQLPDRKEFDLFACRMIILKNVQHTMVKFLMDGSVAIFIQATQRRLE